MTGSLVRYLFVPVMVLITSRTVIGSDLSKFLHAVFDQQQGRQPTGAELNYYANVSRESGPLESYIQMVASRDFYLNQCRGNDELYVTRIHQLFLHREPRPSEVNFWVFQLQQTPNRDLVAFVRQFCQVNNLQQVPSGPLPYQPTFQPPASSASAADLLVTKIALFRQMVSREVGVTRYGTRLLEEVAVLEAAGAQFRDTVNSPRSTDQQISLAGQNLTSAYQDVVEEFRTVPAASSACQNLLWEISRLVQSSESVVRPQPAQAVDPNASLTASVERLRDGLRQVASLLASNYPDNAYYSNLYRDVSGLAVQADSLRVLTRMSQAEVDRQRVSSALLTHARDISRQLGNADYRLQQGWWNVQHELDTIAALMGMGGDFYQSTEQPVVIGAPGWNRFPTQINPGYQASDYSRRIVALADDLLRPIDSYISTLRLLAARNQDAANLLAQTMDLRHDVLVVRQKAAAGEMGSPLRYAARNVVLQYRDVASRTFVAMVGQDARLNSPVWQQIGEGAFELDRAVSNN